MADSPPPKNLRKLAKWTAPPLLGIGALAVRLLWMPVGRHEFEGHEREYLQVFQGSWDGPWSTRVLPSLGTLYRGLGQLSDDPRLLLCVPLVCSLLSIAALVFLLARSADRRSAWLAGGAVVLYGNHAFWSTSAYHVMTPHALLLCGLALLTLAGWGATLGSAALVGAAIGMRAELAPCILAALLLSGGWSWARRLVWLGGAVAVALVSLWPLQHQGAHPEGLLEQVWLALPVNLQLLAYLAPWSNLFLLAGGLALGACAMRRQRRAALFLLALLACSFVTGAAFTDFGYRHALLGGVALCGLQGLGLAELWRWGRAGPRLRLLLPAAASLALLLMLAVDTQRIASWYYAPPEKVNAALKRANPERFPEERLAGCREVSAEPPMPAQQQLTSFSVRGFDACLVWEEDAVYRRWSSLGIVDRGVRMHRSFRMQPLGLRRWPDEQGRPERQIWLLTGWR